ncbi:CurL C-terminal domain-containing protein [Streptomyces olivaceoviridis]
MRRLAERHLDHLAHTPDLAVADLCRTSNTGRAHFRYRMAEVVHDRESALALVRCANASPALEQPNTTGGGSGAPKTAFLFPGMGTQYLGMGTALYRQYPALRDALDAADRVLTPLTGVPLGALMRGECTGTERLNEAPTRSPALFAFE